MKRSVIGLSVVVIAALALVAKAAEPAGAPQALFNGKNLEGWRYYLVDHSVGMEDVWSVRDGVLVCKGVPLGYLYTIKAYKNFKVHVEWRWPPGKTPTNSGVFTRISGRPQGLPHCVEAQLKAGSAGDYCALGGAKIKGDAARMRVVKLPDMEITVLGKMAGTEKEPGEWNTYEILVDGSTMKSWVNGVLANEASDVDVVAGPIGLQSEGGGVEFRNVVVTVLAD